jgi:hypothetical protein
MPLFNIVTPLSSFLNADEQQSLLPLSLQMMELLSMLSKTKLVCYFGKVDECVIFTWISDGFH